MRIFVGWLQRRTARIDNNNEIRKCVNFKNKIVVKKTVIILSVLVLLVSCSSIRKINVSEIEQGKWLTAAQKSHTGQYFGAFSKLPKSNKKYWKVLYQDETNIYFGFVQPKNIISKTEIVEIWHFHQIALEEMGKDIPFYKTDNINHLLTQKIEAHFKEGGRSISGIDIISGNTILRNEEIQYQFEIIYYWSHFERGGQKSKALVIMDKNLNVLDVFYLYN